MAYTYEFTQYNDPGVSQSGGIKMRWLYTSDVAPFTDAEGRTFAPAIIAHDALNLSQERSSGQVYVRTARDFAIAQLFVRGTPAGTIWLRIRDQDTRAVCYSGRVRSAAWTEAEVKLLMSATIDMLQREGLRQHWQASCGWAVYGAGCTVNRNAKDAQGGYLYRADGALVAVSANGVTLTSPAFATRPDKFFEAGLVEVAGQRRMVASHTGSTVELMTPLDGLEVGAPLVVYKGCNRSASVGGCADFGNTANFSGCPNVKKNNIFVNGLEN